MGNGIHHQRQHRLSPPPQHVHQLNSNHFYHFPTPPYTSAKMPPKAADKKPATKAPAAKAPAKPEAGIRPVRPERRRREQRRARRPTLHTFTKSSSKSTQTLVSPTAPCQF